ncbi:cupredoxin domain-containing protein [Ramlibacter sp. PS4R-6]|uniref:cupredoxin domain-containing protein n=1 Tax=Ramlibacter sp. PS4R-6 TaxID=3133438 RepID=UPI0030B63638
MTVSFQRHHVAMLLRYSGISFISGAVNHGFFSGERSLWTAAAGIALFVAGAWMEHRLAVDRDETSLARTLLWGTLLSIGLGFFTGGLQHFPDSPARSSWVVPLGFALSAAALFMGERQALGRTVAAYVLAGTLLVSGASAAAWQWLEGRPQEAQTGHAHEGSPRGAVAQVVTRSVEVVMDDTMRFTPAAIAVKPGETLRIVARNAGRVAHELVIGDTAAIRDHAQAMRAGKEHTHGAAAITVAPGATGELVVTFQQAAMLEMACLVPGHYEAGMRGTVEVAAAEAAPRAPHSGATHKH